MSSQAAGRGKARRNAERNGSAAGAVPARTDAPTAELGPPPSDPDLLRSEIAALRSDLGDTVEALAHKADVKAQAQERIAGLKTSARRSITQTRRALTERGHGLADSSKDLADRGAERGKHLGKDLASSARGRQPVQGAVLGGLTAAVVVLIAWQLTRRGRG